MNNLDVSLAIIKNGAFLLFQVRNKNPYIDHLGLLGGKVENFENPKTAIVREVFEESALDLLDVVYEGKVIEIITTHNTSAQVNLNIFSASCRGILIPKLEEGALIWIHSDELYRWKKKFIPTDWLITQEFLNGGIKQKLVNVYQRETLYEIVYA